MELTPILETARYILSETKKPMHINDIASEAMRLNRNQHMTEDEFAKRLGAALAANLKTKSPSFAKVKNKDGAYKRGIYRLRQSRVKAVELPVAPPAPSTNYLGMAGEHAVMSELLYWGFNASMMAVDDGIDIVASKDNEYFHIQVKTSALGVNGKYAFFIKNSAFNANSGAKTFYLFVMRDEEGRNHYAVFPSVKLSIDRDHGLITTSATGMSISIYRNDKTRTFLMNKGRDITPFINRFDLIKGA